MPRSLFTAATIIGWTILASLTGCSTALNSRVVVQNIQINGQPARFMLDTGGSATLLSFAAVQRLGLKCSPMASGEIAGSLSESVHLTVASRTITTQLPVTESYLSGADGLLGWPEVAGNLLVFDPVHRTVTAAQEVPPQAAGWLKLKIHKPAAQLLLEMPATSGPPGIVLVDTGSPIGISVPSGNWLQWREKHLDAPGSFYGATILGAGYATTDDAWADQFNLGPLALSDLPIAESSAAEASQIENYAGTIGLYGVARMDLIVDFKDGFAYLHPRPPPGPYFPGFDRPGIANDSKNLNNWTLQGEVWLSSHSLGTFVRLLRGEEKQAAGDDRGALDEYNRLLGFRAMDSALRLNREVLQLRLGIAPAEFAKAASEWKDDWDKALAGFVTGDIDEPGLLAAAQSADGTVSPAHECQAFYYIGMMRLLKGDAAGARLYLVKASNTGAKACLEYNLARAEYTRLNRTSPPANHWLSFN